MSEEDVEFVRRALEAFNRRDLGILEAEFCDEDFEFVSFFTGVEASEAATFRGADAWSDYAAVMDETWTDWRIVDIEYFDAGAAGVVCRMRLLGEGKLSGVPVDRSVGITYQLRSGKLWRVRSYADPDDAMRAAGIQP